MPSDQASSHFVPGPPRPLIVGDYSLAHILIQQKKERKGMKRRDKREGERKRKRKRKKRGKREKERWEDDIYLRFIYLFVSFFCFYFPSSPRFPPPLIPLPPPTLLLRFVP